MKNDANLLSLLGPGQHQGKNHKWARVDKYAVRGALRWVYNNQAAAKALGKKAEAFMHSQYTRDAIAEDIHKRLLQIYHMNFRTRDLSESKDHHSLK